MSVDNFIGRESVLEEIDQNLLHVMTAQPRVLLIEGLAGVGKTRLIEEIEAKANLNEIKFFLGRCYEGMPQPYAPYRSLLVYFEEEEELVGYDGHSFLKLLADSTTSVDGLANPVDAKPPKLLIMSVAQAVLKLASNRPIILVVEDLHWSNSSALELFHYLAFALSEQSYAPILLIGTYRPVEANTHLGKILENLKIEKSTRSLILSGFNETETRNLLSQLGVRRPTQQLVEMIHETTQGIPLFIQEVLYHLIRHNALYERDGFLSLRSGALPTIDLPIDLSTAISDRLRLLPLSSQFPLTLASLLSESFDRNVLQAILSLEANIFQEVIEAGVEHRVLVTEGANLRFYHPLLRHAFYSRIDTSRRKIYHLKIAQELLNLYADEIEPYVLEVAHHLVHAGSEADSNLVYTYTLRAASRSFAMYAWADAARYYESALTSLESLSIASLQERADLLYQAGFSHFRNQDIIPAKGCFEQADEIYREIGDIRGRARVLTLLTSMKFTHNSLPMDVMANIQPLHELFGALGNSDPALSAFVLVIISQAYRVTRQSAKADEYAQRALDIARQSNNDFVCSSALNALGLAHLSRLQVEVSIQNWQESARHARRIHDPWRLCLPLLNLPLAYNLKGSLKEAQVQAIEAGEISRQIQDWSGYSKALSHLASIAVASGDFSGTEEFNRQTMLMVERSRYTWGGFRSLQAEACALALRGLWDEAYAALSLIIEPGYLFKNSDRLANLIVRVFKQLIYMYQQRNLDENIKNLSNDLFTLIKDDTYSIAPLCAIIELGFATFNPYIVQKPSDMLSDAMERGVLMSSGSYVRT